MSRQSSGNTCSVINCANDGVKIQLWKKKIRETGPDLEGGRGGQSPPKHVSCPPNQNMGNIYFFSGNISKIYHF